MNGRILIVDDEKLIRETLRVALTDEGFEPETATNGFEALGRLEAAPFDVVITDLRMPSMDGHTLQRTLQERFPDVAVVIMTAFGSVKSAVTAMREGAADYLTKPLDTEELTIRLRRLVERARERAEVRSLRAEVRRLGTARPLIHRSAAMSAVLQRAMSIASTDATILLEGETGCGKDMLARAIHDQSERAAGPYLAVNCAELNPNLIESELFGHEAGAFTGAARARQGRFEAAARGTLLIDEVDDLPREIQVRLLRFLHDRSFERVGSSKTLHGNVRVICATKRSLPALVQAGAFRADLFYRIQTIHLVLPPLRARKEDILPLAEHFLARRASRGIGGVPPAFSPEAMERLRAHDWPGNVRELEHAVEHAAMFARGETILPDHLPASVQGAPRRKILTLDLAGVEHLSMTGVLDESEQAMIDWALARTEGNQARAAEMLGLSRTTLRSRMAALKGGSGSVPGVVDPGE